MFFRPQHFHFYGDRRNRHERHRRGAAQPRLQISGSDLKLSPTTERLAGLGARIYEGHAAANVAGARALVVSSAVDEQNPEVQEARRLQIPVIPRGELLAELMRLKYGIAVAGSHGKTTTTSMAATILNCAGLDPTVVVGGKVGTMGGSNARVGHSDFLVVESDESDGSFLKLAPILAVVTNIDREHLDHYPSLDAIRAAFIEFVNKVPFYGAAIVCLDDANVQGILPPSAAAPSPTAPPRRPIWKPARSPAALFERFPAALPRGHDLGRFHLRIPGRHNVLNATAAVAVALELEVKAGRDSRSAGQFSGVDRRFQVRGKERGITVVDDYGHHPTEIRATLDGARLCGFRAHPRAVPAAPLHAHLPPDGRIRARLPSGRQRVRAGHLRRLGKAHRRRDGRGAGGAHPAVRPPRRGIRGHASTRGVERLLGVARPGDLVLTLGAGNVWQAGDVACASTAMAAFKLRDYLSTDPRFALSRDRRMRCSSAGCATHREGAARLRRRFRPRNSPCRWPSGAAVCWRSIGWKMLRSRASGRTAWWCASASASRWRSSTWAAAWR
jgi:UDP-N-acetylmuramate--alanine ligase